MKLFNEAGITALILLALSTGVTADAADAVNPDPCQRIVIVLLFPDIDKAIHEYYGVLLNC